MVTLPEHDHCRNCGDPVPFDMAYCCEACYWEFQGKAKKEKRTMYLYATAVVMSVVVLTLIRGLL